MALTIEDIEGLDEVLSTLANYNLYNNDERTISLGGELEKDLERIRFRLTKIERKLGLREEQDTCIVCNRVITGRHNLLLCKKHFIEWPPCPNCGNSDYKALVWVKTTTPSTTPKIYPSDIFTHIKVAECKKCKKGFSYKEMQDHIIAYWIRKYEE